MDYQLEVIDLTNLPPANAVLCEKELDFYNRLKIQKRKTEWLGGRLALKKLLATYTGRPLTDFSILVPVGVGKPVITAEGGEVHIPFSLTHSNGFAVAAIAPDKKYIGIDLEKIASRIRVWKTDFFHPAELSQEDDTFLTALWTQKEAVVKLLGSGLTINTFDVRLVGGIPQFFNRALEIYQSLGSPQITLNTSSLISGFCFSVAVA